MVEIEKNGQRYTFSLDLDRICEMELKNPDFNFLTMLANAGEEFRLSTIVTLCDFLGSDYKTMVKQGFTITDISEILTKAMEEIGFFSDR